MTHLHNLLQNTDDIIQFDDRFKRPYAPISAEYFNELYSTILPHIESCKSILDVGCNIGSSISFLRRAGWTGEYVGIDNQEIYIERARHLNKGEQFLTADCFDFLYDVNTHFDVTLCVGVLHGFIEPFSLLRGLAQASNMMVFDTRNIKHLFYKSTDLVANEKYALISSQISHPLATESTETFDDILGLGCYITTSYVELFLNSINFVKHEFDDSLLTHGVFKKDEVGVPRRQLQIFKRGTVEPTSNLETPIQTQYKNILK